MAAGKIRELCVGNSMGPCGIGGTSSFSLPSLKILDAIVSVVIRFSWTKPCVSLVLDIDIDSSLCGFLDRENGTATE